MNAHLPVILIEVVLIFGGVLAFGWWQLRDLEKEREQTTRKRERRETADAQETMEDPDATP
jgi:predicted negative regulator of RcsB-dependent stress response